MTTSVSLDNHRSSPVRANTHFSNIYPESHKTYTNLEMENEILARSNKVQADKLTDMYTKSDTLTFELMNREKDNDLKEAKILNQEKDINILSKNLDDKNKTYAIIKEKLMQKSEITTKLANERNALFNNLEKEKFETNTKIIQIQDEFNQIENVTDTKISEWVNKHNIKEAELENNKIH